MSVKRSATVPVTTIAVLAALLCLMASLLPGAAHAQPAGSVPAKPAPAKGRLECGLSQETQRVALLIGNGGYDGADWDSLGNAGNDVAQLCEVFAKARFRVIRLIDADVATARSAIAEFATLSQQADTALVYYAGHGFEFGGENYLVPVDAPRFASKTGLKERFLPLDDVMGAAKAKRFNLFFLDACRSFDAVVELTDIDPGGRDGAVSTIGLPRGGTGVVFYSTVKGSPALDDAPPANDAISPFAAAIAKHTLTPGLELDQYLKIVAREVEERTKSVIDPAQYPVRYGQFREDFFLMPVPNPARARTGAARVSGAGALAMSIPQVGSILAGFTLQQLATEDETYIVGDVLSRAGAPYLSTFARTDKDPVAQYLVGYMQQYGLGLPKNLDSARRWLEQSAAQGHPAGQLELANFLTLHAPNEAARARELYELAAAQDFAKAKTRLGDLLLADATAERDRSKADALKARARGLFSQAAEKGHPRAMFTLGAQLGDKATSRRLLAALAASGDREGDHWLCELAFLEKDIAGADASRHCARGASGGFAGSQFVQARRHQSGAGVPKSAREADYWARLALSHKDLDTERRAILGKLMLLK